MFTPRLTKPGAGNPYYNQPPKGYAVGIIDGNPQDAGCDVLANCIGYAAGRFNEIIGAGKFVYFQYAPNPRDWIATAKTYGLQTGTEPKLGAALVWQKHVCIVEEMHDDGSITTSESGYGCTPSFWTTLRNNKDGVWNGGGFGKFHGFIYQPKGVEQSMKKGIDISYCQTQINWNEVTAEFVIIKAGQRDFTDPLFESHYKGSKSRGIPVGAYWYLDALTVDDAKKEADAFIQRLSGKQFEYPVFLDLENEAQFRLGKEKVSALIRAFLERVEQAGYWVGLYGNLSSLTYYTTDDIKKRYSVWLAQWDVNKPTYTGSYGIWQHSVGKADGVNGACDLDYCYVDYPTQIKAKGLNGFGTPKPPKPPETDDEIAVTIEWQGKTYKGKLKAGE